MKPQTLLALALTTFILMGTVILHQNARRAKLTDPTENLTAPQATTRAQPDQPKLKPAAQLEVLPSAAKAFAQSRLENLKSSILLAEREIGEIENRLQSDDVIHRLNKSSLPDSVRRDYLDRLRSLAKKRESLLALRLEAIELEFAKNHPEQVSSK